MVIFTYLQGQCPGLRDNGDFLEVTKQLCQDIVKAFSWEDMTWTSIYQVGNPLQITSNSLPKSSLVNNEFWGLLTGV